MENNIFLESHSRFLEGVKLSHQSIERTGDIVWEKALKENHSSIEKEARKAFQEYLRFIDPYLPKVHGAVLLEDNEVKESYSEKATPVKTKIGTLFKNTTYLYYPTRTYLLPETQEIVVYRVHDEKEFPEEENPFRGFDDYRKHWPDNFSKIIKAHTYKNWMHRFSTSEIMETVEEIESKIPEKSDINRDELRNKRETLQKKIKESEQQMDEAETKMVEPIKKRIKQLINVLQTRTNLKNDSVIFLRETANTTKDGKKIAEYLLVEDINIVTSPMIPRLKRKIARNLSILDKPEGNNHLFITGAKYISKEIIKNTIGYSPI